MALNIDPINIKASVKNLQKSPKVVGYFSRNKGDDVQMNFNQFKYIRNNVKQHLPFDLNYKTSNYRRCDQDTFLLYLNHIENVLGSDKSDVALADAPIVSGKATFSEILSIPFHPYKRHSPLRIHVALYKGTIFMTVVEGEEKFSAPNHVDKPSSWGMKFKDYMTTESPNGKVNVDTVEQPGSMVYICESKLEDHSLRCISSVDGVICQENDHEKVDWETLTKEEILDELNKRGLVDLHTTKLVVSPKQDIMLKKCKMVHWWSQAFLLGIKHVQIGFLDEDGMCKQVKQFTTEELAEKGSEFWSSSKCLTFADTFFSFVKKSLADKIKRMHPQINTGVNVRNCPETSLVFQLAPNSKVVTVIHHPSTKSFLPNIIRDSQ